MSSKINENPASKPEKSGSTQKKRKYARDKLCQKIRRQVGTAIADYNMIEQGDKVLVCLSGGKDSYTLLDMLSQLQKKAPVHFELMVFHLDQKQPGYPSGVMSNYLRNLNLSYKIVEVDTYSIVNRTVPEGRTMCGLCSRLRRGVIYRFAAENGIDKIALGHHRDDIVETLFLNMFFGSKLKAMPPKLESDDRRHVVIRPLAYCRESDLLNYSESARFPIIPCNLCGSQNNLQRVKVKKMLNEWEAQHPGRVENIFRSLKSIVPSHLADTNLYDFVGMASSQGCGTDSLRWIHQN